MLPGVTTPATERTTFYDVLICGICHMVDVIGWNQLHTNYFVLTIILMGMKATLLSVALK